MNADCRRLLKKLNDTGVIDKKSKSTIKLLLQEGYFESQVIAREDIKSIFEEMDVSKITDNEMEEIASLIKGADLVDNSYWDNLEAAARQILNIPED